MEMEEINETNEVYMEECNGFEGTNTRPEDKAGTVCGLGCMATGSRCGTCCGITGSGKHCGWFCE